jgi:magnesium transporter
VGLFFGDGWLVTISRETVPPVAAVWSAVVEDRTERLLQRGPDYVASRILDRVVDEYFDVLDGIEAQLEAIEDAVIDSTDIDTLEGINAVRRDLLAFRKVAWPTREAVSVLARGETAYVQESTEKYFRDVHDHLVQVVDLIQTYRDLASGARDIYLNTLSQSTNEVMKTLTVVATIFIPLTFVVGVYGMNFRVMPELDWPYGYPAVLAGMALLALLLVGYFRRRGWV